MSNISEILEKYKDSRSMEFAIYNAFYLAARRFAESLISEEYRLDIDESDIANHAMKSTLSELAKDNLDATSSDDFRKLLFTIVRYKVADQVRFLDRAKRKHGPMVPLEPNLTPDKAVSDPSVKAVVNELSSHAVVKLLQRHIGEGLNPFRVYIAAMGTLYEMKAPDIESALIKNFPGQKIPAKRTIELQSQRDREYFKAVLKESPRSDDD